MADDSTFTPSVQALLDRGVRIPSPGQVEVGDTVVPDRIAPGVVLHAGTRLRGADLAIGPGSVIGEEAPATVEQCQLGAGVALKGGFFSGATFLDGAGMGSAAHVRPGTLLEEQANGAHAAGFKQTILFPFVTAGSLINFCDALMAGGTSRRNHSEIGSSYIHFNFTPHQDKATASLIGDVPRGVMLDQPPIFLGGQGGLVGPSRIAFGCVIPAGVIYRHDALEPGRLLFPGAGTGRKGSLPYDGEAYGSIDRIVANNLHFIGNIRALDAWYRAVRSRFMTGDPYQSFCHEGALRRLEEILQERLRRLAELAGRMPPSVAALRRRGGEANAAIAGQQDEFVQGWPGMAATLTRRLPESCGARERDAFLGDLDRHGAGGSCLDAIRALPAESRQQGTAWLQAVVDSVVSIWHAS